VAAAADAAVYSGSATAAEEQFKLFLRPEDQIATLKGTTLLAALRLPAETRIIAEPPTPTEEEAKADPKLDELRKARLQQIPNRVRLSASQSGCYHELIVLGLAYAKSPLNGRLWSTFSFRTFFADPKATKVVERGLLGTDPGHFPALQPDQIDAARADIQAAFAKDFTAWAGVKVKASPKAG
jgi:hypothetical protein